MSKIFKEFENGIKLYYRQNTEHISFMCKIFIDCIEMNPLPGAAHFVEHILFKGVKGLDNKNNFVQYLENQGIVINAITTNEFICFEIQTMEESSLEIISLITKMIFEPEITYNDFISEQKIILEEFEYLETDEEYIAKTLIAQKMWQDNYKGIPVIGTKESIQSISYETLLSIIKNIKTEDIFICLYGSQNIDSISKILDTIPKTDKFSPLRIPKREYPTNSYVSQGTKLTYTCLGFKVENWKENKRWVYDLINLYLGEGMSSKLFTKIREEKALVYDIWSKPNYFQDGLQFLIGYITRNNNIDLTLSEVIKQLQMMKYISEDELLILKKRLKSEIIYSYDNPDIFLFDVGRHYLLKNEIYNLNEILEDINCLTIEKVKSIINQTFTEKNMTTVKVGYTT